VVGYFSVPQGYDNSGMHGFIYSRGSFSYIVDPNDNNNIVFATGINDNGWIVGYDYIGGSCEVYIYSYYQGNMSVPVCYGEDSFVDGINNSGEFVGAIGATGDIGYTNTLNNFYHDPTTYITFPDAKATFATGINNLGEIVGSYEDSSGNYHGFCQFWQTT
jgi:uncharacterized membrane protein